MLTVFLLAAVAQLFFWGYYLSAGYYIGKSPVRPVEADCPPVSVVVCFHNEVATLADCLNGILAQDYGGEFEVVAVDDNSTDGSADIVRQLIKTVPKGRLRLVQPGPTRPGKKDALTFGVGQAKHNILLLTDADCIPASSQWLDRMTLPFLRDAEVVLGVGRYANHDNSWLALFQRYEAAYVALKYLGFAARGLPYMGVGRNLAYRRSFFDRAGGLADHADLPSGDDDLLVGLNAAPERTARVTDPAAQTVSALSPDLATFLRQRRRHQSTGGRYRLRLQVLLGGLALSYGLFFLLGLFLLFSSWWWLALVIYVVRFVLVMINVRLFNVIDLIDEPTYSGAGAGAKTVERSKVVPLWKIAVLDALVAPFYLYLAVSGSSTEESW